MIDSINGRIKFKEPTRCVIDCGGVGYELFIPFSTYQNLPDRGEIADLYAHLVHRDTAMELFGFASQKERSLFRKLITVSGIGPKIGIAILSGMDVDSFIAAIKNDESGYLTKISGIGKKTAQRLVVELRDKVKDIVVSREDEPKPPADSEALEVLLALGYKKPEAKKALEKVVAEKGKLPVEKLIKLTLKEI